MDDSVVQKGSAGYVYIAGGQVYKSTGEKINRVKVGMSKGGPIGALARIRAAFYNSIYFDSELDGDLSTETFAFYLEVPDARVCEKYIMHLLKDVATERRRTCRGGTEMFEDQPGQPVLSPEFCYGILERISVSYWSLRWMLPREIQIANIPSRTYPLVYNFPRPSQLRLRWQRLLMVGYRSPSPVASQEHDSHEGDDGSNRGSGENGPQQAAASDIYGQDERDGCDTNNDSSSDDEGDSPDMGMAVVTDTVSQLSALLPVSAVAASPDTVRMRGWRYRDGWMETLLRPWNIGNCCVNIGEKGLQKLLGDVLPLPGTTIGIFDDQLDRSFSLKIERYSKGGAYFLRIRNWLKAAKVANDDILRLKLHPEAAKMNRMDTDFGLKINRIPSAEAQDIISDVSVDKARQPIMSEALAADLQKRRPASCWRSSDDGWFETEVASRGRNEGWQTMGGNFIKELFGDAPDPGTPIILHDEFLTRQNRPTPAATFGVIHKTQN